MHFFLLLNTKVDRHIVFSFPPNYESQWDPSIVWSPILFNSAEEINEYKFGTT